MVGWLVSWLVNTTMTMTTYYDYDYDYLPLTKSSVYSSC